MNQNNWRVMSRSLAESNKYTEIISAGRPYPGRLIEPKEQDDEAMYKTLDILWDRHYGIKKFPRRGIVHDVAVFTWEAACKYCKGVRS
jgi:hypothetical protein